MRFGQSIIADSEEYRVPGTNRVIKLGDLARQVVNEVNPHIKNALHKFHFMNTKTGVKDSPHAEQRNSATYYALSKHHIPAFGVETSKFLPSMDLKVRYHNLVINAFKKLFDIVPESPGLVLDPPVLKYLVVSINGQIPRVVKENQILELRAGDSVNVSHIEANYERGLSLDILGYGDLNDYRRGFAIFRETTIIVRKDNHRFAEIPVRISEKSLGDERTTSRPKKIEYFIIEMKGHRLLLPSGKTLYMVRGDKLKIVDVLPSDPILSGLKVNFKGFVGDRKNNTGEDRGYVIDTEKDLLKRYSLHKKGESYEIIASQGDRVMARIVLKLRPPRMDYIILRINNHRHLFLRSEDAVSLNMDDEICVEEIQTNLYSNKGVHLSINGHKIKPGDIRKLDALYSAQGYSNHQVQVKKGPLVLGKVFIHMD